jgi:hypothetical protein
VRVGEPRRRQAGGPGADVLAADVHQRLPRRVDRDRLSFSRYPLGLLRDGEREAGVAGDQRVDRLHRDELLSEQFHQRLDVDLAGGSSAPSV